MAYVLKKSSFVCLFLVLISLGFFDTSPNKKKKRFGVYIIVKSKLFWFWGFVWLVGFFP